MADLQLLRSEIDKSGMTIVAIAEKSGIKRETLYNRLNGNTDFSASEIVSMTRVLHLTKELRDKIFLSERCN